MLEERLLTDQNVAQGRKVIDGSKRKCCRIGLGAVMMFITFFFYLVFILQSLII